LTNRLKENNTDSKW